MYKTQKFRLRPLEEIKKDILMAKDLENEIRLKTENKDTNIKQLAYQSGLPWLMDGEVNRIFLADSNSLIIDTPELVDLVKFIHKTFPNLERVTSYARAKTITEKNLVDLKKIRKAGLTRLHVGLETGDPELLRIINKGVTPEEQIEAGKKALKAGFELTEYVLLGLGGKEYQKQHAINTAKVINQINPTWVRVRTLMLRPKTILNNMLKRGEFHEASALDIVKETRLLIENIDCTTEFLSDHNSNYLQLNGKFPDDKNKLLRIIDDVLETIRLVPGSENKLFPPDKVRHL
jgi:radical SAM superfamily enzyme YgiQ (UPF0313 family)